MSDLYVWCQQLESTWVCSVLCSSENCVDWLGARRFTLQTLMLGSWDTALGKREKLNKVGERTWILMDSDMVWASLQSCKLPVGFWAVISSLLASVYPVRGTEVTERPIARNSLSYIASHDWGFTVVAVIVSDSWNFMDCSPPSSSVCGISQARILEWVGTHHLR